MPESRQAPRDLSRDPRVGLVMLVVSLTVGGWLAYDVHRTIGLGAPRFWTLLRDERVFDIAMLDFALTSSWAALVLLDRRGRNDWRFWLAAATFLVVPSVGIGLFLWLRCGRDPGEADRGSRQGGPGTPGPSIPPRPPA